MIRIGNDKRKLHSAELLLDGLVSCMAEKSFAEISVSDLQKKSGVSRATFYRLFDNTQDILAYKCRLMSLEIADTYSAIPESKRENFLLFTLRYWLKNHQFLDAVFKSGRSDILQSALAENSGFLRSRFPEDIFTPDVLDYLVSAAMGQLSGILVTWVRHGKKETPEQLLEIFMGFSELVPALLRT